MLCMNIFLIIIIYILPKKRTIDLTANSTRYIYIYTYKKNKLILYNRPILKIK